MLVTSYSTHAPVNLWCEHVLFWGNDMEAKTTRGYRLSLQTVWLQSPVSNLNLLCHLKSPWTNLTLACNNRLEECLSVLCVRPQAYLLWSWHWKIMTHAHTHTQSNSQTQEINQNYMQHRGLLAADSMWHRHMNTGIKLCSGIYIFFFFFYSHWSNIQYTFLYKGKENVDPSGSNHLIADCAKRKDACFANASYTIT